MSRSSVIWELYIFSQRDFHIPATFKQAFFYAAVLFVPVFPVFVGNYPICLQWILHKTQNEKYIHKVC